MLFFRMIISLCKGNPGEEMANGIQCSNSKLQVMWAEVVALRLCLEATTQRACVRVCVCMRVCMVWGLITGGGRGQGVTTCPWKESIPSMCSAGDALGAWTGLDPPHLRVDTERTSCRMVTRSDVTTSTLSGICSDEREWRRKRMCELVCECLFAKQVKDEGACQGGQRCTFRSTHP